MLSLLPVLPLLFTEATDKLGADQPCSGEREGCYSNYVALADLDGDGDLDAVFASGGGYYVPDEADPMAVYLNDGAAGMTEVNATSFGGFTGRLRQVAIGDIDGDGDLDVIAPDSWAMQPDAVFINNGAQPPVFANEGMTRLGSSSRAGAARLGDLDGDLDLDLVLTDWGAEPFTSPGTAKVYLNDGGGRFTERAGAVPADTSAIGTGPIDADLFDADGDFDLDLILASRQGESLFFRNDGSGSFASAQGDLPDQPGPYVYGPDACDVDGDSDLDLWLDNGFEGLREQLVLNDGTGTFTDVTAANVTGDADADDNEVQCVDIDNDGDLDALVASLANNERFMENDGAGKFDPLADGFPTVGDATLGLDLGDLNGDGRLDAITAQGEFGDFTNRLYLGDASQAVDDRAPVIRAVESGPELVDGPSLRVRFAVSDRMTTDVGPRLRSAWVQVGEEKIPAAFVGGDLFHARVLVDVDAKLVYKVCAEDLGGASACSEDLTWLPPLDEPDAGPGPGTPDAGPGPGPEPEEDDDGCGCRTTGGAEAGLWGVVLGLALFLRRRRKE